MAMIIADSSMERARDYESQDQSRLVPRALCRSEYHKLIEDPDEVTQREDGDDDPEHDKPGETWPKVIR
jgi:hypothetical protein